MVCADGSESKVFWKLNNKYLPCSTLVIRDPLRHALRFATHLFQIQYLHLVLPNAQTSLPRLHKLKDRPERIGVFFGINGDDQVYVKTTN